MLFILLIHMQMLKCQQLHFNIYEQEKNHAQLS